MVVMETMAVTKVLFSDFSTCFHVLKVTRFHCRQMAEQKVILIRINDHFVSDYLKHTKLKVCESQTSLGGQLLSNCPSYIKPISSTTQ